MVVKDSNKLKIASVIAIASAMTGKLLAFVREIKIAEVLGASNESDAYNVAYLLVITIFGLFSSAYSNSLMPIASEKYMRDQKKMNKVVNEIITISLMIMLFIIVSMYLFPHLYVRLMAAGMNQETIELTASLIKISAWALPFLVLISSYTIVLRVYNRNVYPSVVDILFPLPILFALLYGVTSPSILILCVVLGYGIKFLALLAGAINVGFYPKLGYKTNDHGLKEFFLLMPPMLLSSGLLQINTLVDNQVVSKFGTGSVTMLSLASKVDGLAYTVFSTSLLQIAYSIMTKEYMKDNKDEFVQVVKKQVKMILLFIIPCFIVLFNFSTEIMTILFVRGNYSHEDAAIAGKILSGYAVGLPIFVLRDICIYIFYSAKDSKYPSLVTGGSVFINIGLNIVLSTLFGISGVAYATSISAIVSFVFLLLRLNRDILNVKKLVDYKLLFNILPIAISWLLAALLKNKSLEQNNTIFIIASFAIIFISFWFVYFIVDFCTRKLK